MVLEMFTQRRRPATATFRTRTLHLALFATLVPALTSPALCTAQTAPPLIQSSSTITQHMEQERQKMAADQRQQKMVSDADKLLQMAQQLKVSVDKTDRNTLSVEVVREAERIEKLARQVREGMRQ